MADCKPQPVRNVYRTHEMITYLCNKHKLEEDLVIQTILSLFDYGRYSEIEIGASILEKWDEYHEDSEMLKVFYKSILDDFGDNTILVGACR